MSRSIYQIFPVFPPEHQIQNLLSLSTWSLLKLTFDLSVEFPQAEEKSNSLTEMFFSAPGFHLHS